MMKISTKLITFGLVLAVAAGAFSGCNDNKDTAEGTTGTTAAATKEAVSGTETENLPEDTLFATETTSATVESVVTEPAETEPEATEGLFMIDYADNVLGNYTEYGEYVWDDSYPVKAVLHTDGAVTGIKLLRITDNFDGNEPYKTELVHDYGYITKDRPLVLTLSFHGDVSPYGVSVTDAVGDTVVFRIEMSGFDGSLLLTEIG